MPRPSAPANGACRPRGRRGRPRGRAPTTRSRRPEMRRPRTGKKPTSAFSTGPAGSTALRGRKRRSRMTRDRRRRPRTTRGSPRSASAGCGSRLGGEARRELAGALRGTGGRRSIWPGCGSSARRRVSSCAHPRHGHPLNGLFEGKDQAAIVRGESNEEKFAPRDRAAEVRIVRAAGPRRGCVCVTPRGRTGLVEPCS